MFQPLYWEASVLFLEMKSEKTKDPWDTFTQFRTWIWTSVSLPTMIHCLLKIPGRLLKKKKEKYICPNAGWKWRWQHQFKQGVLTLTLAVSSSTVSHMGHHELKAFRTYFGQITRLSQTILTGNIVFGIRQIWVWITTSVPHVEKFNSKFPFSNNNHKYKFND